MKHRITLAVVVICSLWSVGRVSGGSRAPELSPAAAALVDACPSADLKAKALGNILDSTLPNSDKVAAITILDRMAGPTAVDVLVAHVTLRYEEGGAVQTPIDSILVARGDSVVDALMECVKQESLKKVRDNYKLRTIVNILFSIKKQNYGSFIEEHQDKWSPAVYDIMRSYSIG
jgi:hypothetical protein